MRTVKKIKLIRVFIANMAAMILIVGMFPVLSVRAVGSFDNALIADVAEGYANGSTGGQCKEFVNNVVHSASGSTISLGGYQSGFNAYGDEVSAANATRGDIIQITPEGSTDATVESMYNQNIPSMRLHTAIIRASRNADGTFNVIDSNWDSNEKVERHVFNPYTYASGAIIKIWRLGTVEEGSTNNPRADFNGTGKSDILWYGPGTASDAIWYGSGTRNLDGVGFETSYDISVSGNYTPIDGNFDGDNYADILWYGPGTASDAIWYGTGTKGVFVKTYDVNVNGTYDPFVGDFDGDGKDDIFWYGPGSNSDTMWFGSSSRATGFSTGHSISVNGTYEPLSGDFDADGKWDVVWYGAGGAEDKIWYGAQTRGSFNTGYDINVNGTYDPLVGDFDGDNKYDIFWYGPGDDADTMWFGSSSRATGFSTGYDTSVAGTYTPISGDFDGDSKWDVVWYGPGSAQDKIWYGNQTRGSFNTTYDINVSGTYTPIPS